MSEERNVGCRLYKEEAEYLDKYWDGKFSDYAHNSFKRDITLSKNNKRFNVFQTFLYSFITLGIGCIFVLFSLYTLNLLVSILLMLLGAFFVFYGLVSIFVGVFVKWKNF